MANIAKVLDGAANPVLGSVERIVGNSPGFVLTSDNPKEFVSNIKNSIELGKDEAEGGLKDFGIGKALDIADSISPALGDLGRKILGRQRVDKTSLPTDPLIAPADSWYSLARKRRDPLLAFEWDVEMPQIGNMKLPNSYVEEAQINLPSVEDWSVFRNGTKAYYAGFSDVGNLTITCYEDNRLSTMSYFAAWFGTIQNQETGTYSAPTDYLKDIRLYVTAPTSSGYERIGTLIAHGCFPKDRQGLNFSSGTSDRQRIAVTFTVNNVSYISNFPFDTDLIVAANAQISQNPAKQNLLAKVLQLMSPDNDLSQPKFALNLQSPFSRLKNGAGL